MSTVCFSVLVYGEVYGEFHIKCGEVELTSQVNNSAVNNDRGLEGSKAIRKVGE